jgi:hypothetical protein
VDHSDHRGNAQADFASIRRGPPAVVGRPVPGIRVCGRSGSDRLCLLRDARLFVAASGPRPEGLLRQVGRQLLANRGIPYVTGSPANVWVWTFDGDAQPRQRQITHFTDDRQILDVAWSRDGTRLAVARATLTRDIVLIKGLKK